MSNVSYYTEEGLKKLKDELKQLTTVKREEVARRIQEARAFGDLSENAAYDAARDEQARIEARISELEEILKNAQVSKGGTSAIVVGSKVTLHIDGDEEIFHIVGAPEADPMSNRVSHESPLGSSLLGKKVGETIDVEAPVGKLTYKILKIE